MKKIIALFISLNLFLTTNISAQSTQSSTYQIPCISRYCTLEDVINAFTSILRPLFILTFGAMIIYAGWLRMTSRGNPDKIADSSKTIIAAIIGFTIIVLAPTLVVFLLNLLGVTAAAPF